MVAGRTRRRATRRARRRPRSSIETYRRRHAADDRIIGLGEDARRSAPASSRSGTTASSCPTRTWRRRPAPPDAVTVGTVTHKLKVGGNDQLEIYDYPGGYAQRFDGVDPGGGDRAGRRAEDLRRTASAPSAIRMQQETLPGLVIDGESNCRHCPRATSSRSTDHFDANGALRADARRARRQPSRERTPAATSRSR